MQPPECADRHFSNIVVRIGATLQCILTFLQDADHPEWLAFDFHFLVDRVDIRRENGIRRVVAKHHDVRIVRVVGFVDPPASFQMQIHDDGDIR